MHWFLRLQVPLVPALPRRLRGEAEVGRTFHRSVSFFLTVSRRLCEEHRPQTFLGGQAGGLWDCRGLG